MTSMLNPEIFLKDYRTPNYWIESTDLEFNLQKDFALVTASLILVQNPEHEINELVLTGVDLELQEIFIDGNKLDAEQYSISGEKLILKGLPKSCTLKTVVKITPEKNFTGEGLYKSGQIFCTQCEAEGFRRITYYLDRPDVMSSFRTKLIAHQELYPVLLSNGNKVDSGPMSDGKHYAVWEDPFKKPCYLFACVFGDLALVQDSFQTRSGKNVALEIYVDKGNEDKCGHAMVSLQNSMKWDEEVFGLEYDLDIYMVVAVDSFNMGAMENKGLNIFNSAYVLAKQSTATDSDFQGIEAVIGHEYFHNWTGNRVTCRDWFQLTLKEGLTVFRDQEFSSDMLSRSVKRIEDVKGLRSHQFPEDSGPLSHPIKPKSFVEINNFYTSTIYEKGAEVIRMIYTLIGKESFRKGMDLYFSRHDGQAVTTEDFVSAMSASSGRQFDHFSLWYDQNGTPQINVEMIYNEDEKTCTLHIEQVKLNLNNNDYESLNMPFHIALYSSDGRRFELPENGKLELSKLKESFIFKGIDVLPIPSLNMNFSAPVIVKYPYSKTDLSTLMSYDQDDFNRYDAAQLLSEIEIYELMSASKDGLELLVSEEYITAFGLLLNDESLSSSFKAYALSLPGHKEINDKLELFEFDHLPKALEAIKNQIAVAYENELSSLVFALEQKGVYSLTTKAMGDRALKGFALALLAQTNTPSAMDLIYSQFQKASNMTDEISALSVLFQVNNPYKEKALESFYAKWKNDTLVMQKWIRVQSASPILEIENLKSIEKLEIYDKKIPNLFRALASGFVKTNTKLLHNIDGSGYKFIADHIIEMDSINPQIAAGLCKSLNFLKKCDSTRAHLLSIQLIKIRDYKTLSSDTMEVVRKNLG